MRGSSHARCARASSCRDKMDKTVVVVVERLVQAPAVQEVRQAAREVQGARREQPLRVGDRVVIIETRPPQQGQALARATHRREGS